MSRNGRTFATAAGLGLLTLVYGCATGGGGGGGGGGEPQPEGEVFDVDTGDAGAVTVTADQTQQSAGDAELGGEPPANLTSGTASVPPDGITFTGAEGVDGADALIVVHIAPAAAETPCAHDFQVLSFLATLTAGGTIELSDVSGGALDQTFLDAVASGQFTLCFEVTANFTGTVTIRTVRLDLSGGEAPDNENDNTAIDFFTCTSPGGEDDDVEFGEPGTTRVVASTLGEGRHMLLNPDWPLVFDFDQPVRFCAVIPEHFTLTNVNTGQEIDIPAANLTHQHLTEGGVVVASRVTIDLPAEVTAGEDYELAISGTGLSLDGDFQVNAGTALAANGTLPSGDGTAGGDFVQLLRAVNAINYLTNTPAAGAMTLDDQDRLYVVGDAGLYGPFDAPTDITEANRLGADLPTISSRNIVYTNDGTLIVKGQSDGKVFEVDPDSSVANEVADADDLDSYPKSSVRAPAGFSSIELTGVQEGDILFADDSGVSVLDLAAGTGLKGGQELVARSDINSAYVSLWAPPVAAGKPGEVWGGHKPEDFDAGFQIHRILPNGVVDRFVLPRSLFGFDGTSAAHLQDVQGRTEFLLLGDVTDFTAFELSEQVLPADFDGVGLYVFDATRNRLQLVVPLPLKTFAFDFDAFSQVILTPDYDRAYVSLPTSNVVLSVDGLANPNPDGDWPCDSVYDEGVELTDGNARVVASTFGLGRYLLNGGPMVAEFELDQPVAFCAFNADNVTLMETATGQDIALADGDVKRIPIYAGNQMVACRIMIDLPSSLAAGAQYELTLSGDGFGLDGEFDGSLPSGDLTPGGDFVQTFTVIEGRNFLTETRRAPGITIDRQDRIFVANEDQVYGPFAAAAQVTEADALGTTGIISGGGRPITVANDGRLVVTERNGTVEAIDPDTGIVNLLASDVGGTFEVDMVTAPAGFNGTVASPGDLIVFNAGRGTIANVDTAFGGTTFFTDSDVSNAYVNFFVPPADLFGPAVYASYNMVTPNVAFTVRQVTADGVVQDNLFAQPLDGVEGKGVIRLPDSDGAAQWLVLADFSTTASPQLPTRQVREPTAGLQLLVYDAGADQVQVLGEMSRGLEDDFTSPEVDFAFEQDLNTVYITQPITRTVVELTGFGG